MYCYRNQKDWDEILPYVTYAYRTLYNPAVKDVPFFLLYGYEPVLPHEMYILPAHINQTLAERERNAVAQRLNHARNLARTVLQATQEQMKKRADANMRTPRIYQPGDLVMSYKPQLGPEGTRVKLARLYDGPYQVQNFLPGSRTISLVHTRTGETRLAHVDNVKPFKPAPDDNYEAPPPQLSPQQEYKAIQQLERACAVAKHVVGNGAARATAASVLGQLQVPQLPPAIQAMLLPTGMPAQPKPAPKRPRTAPKDPSTAAPPPPPPPTQSTTASWKGDQPWFTQAPLSSTIPTHRTAAGRNVRPLCW